MWFVAFVLKLGPGKGFTITETVSLVGSHSERNKVPLLAELEIIDTDRTVLFLQQCCIFLMFLSAMITKHIVILVFLLY